MFGDKVVRWLVVLVEFGDCRVAFDMICRKQRKMLADLADLGSPGRQPKR